MNRSTRPLELIENGEPVEVRLDAATGVALASSGLVDATPALGGHSWAIRPMSKVGAVRVGHVEVHVAPKVPIERVVFLLGYTYAGVRWTTDQVGLGVAPDLLRAVVEVFTRTAERALTQGLLQGYRTVEDAMPVVRGRILEAEQIRRRHGLMVPVEVRFDDFTVDTAENRLLRAGVLRALRVPDLPPRLRHRLLRLDLLLADVTPVRSRARLEEWRPSRLNARLHPALRLAEVIVRATSFEQGEGGLDIHGFVIDMARVFEDFVCTALGTELRTLGGATRNQDRWHLDVAGEVTIKPDLVWYDDDGTTPRAVVDAKYKAEKPSGFPDADLYQVLAYCTALGLSEGHLVYAKGNEAGRVHEVVNAGVVIRAHTLNLAARPDDLLDEVSRLAATIATPRGTTPVPLRLDRARVAEQSALFRCGAAYP